MRTLTLPALLSLSLALLIPALAPAEALAQSDISAELVVATGVQNHEPVGTATSFPADVGTVFAWMRVTGATNQAIEVVWRFGDRSWTVPLEIGGSPWRTWSSKIIPPFWDGTWTVEVRDAQGNTLASSDFTVGT